MDLPAHQLTMTVLMTPDTANFAGNVHGGHLLKWLDQVAYACASRYAGRYTSMEIGIKVLAMDIRSQAQRHVNSCFFTMVAVDDDRRPVAVPPLRPFTPDEKRREEAAKLRKQLRREFSERFAAVMELSR